MRRRDFVKAIVATAVFTDAVWSQTTSPPPLAGAPAPAPTPWMRGLDHLKSLTLEPTDPQAIATAELRFFNPQQMATLSRLGDLLLPPYKGFPGAKDAGTPAFLDLLIGESSAEQKVIYQNGLGWLDAEAGKKFKLPFAQLTDEQADEILRPWLRTWMTDHPPIEPNADFLATAHSDIRTATMNSEVWSKAADRIGREPTATGLYWSPVEPDIYRENYGRMPAVIPATRAMKLH